MASAPSSGAEDSSEGVAGSSSGIVLDMGLLPDFRLDPPPGCKGKIDFLFLIARTWTMVTEQEQLLASLPGFLSTIEATFPDFDSHIIVANPDGIWPGWGCEVPELCGTAPHTCDPFAPGYQCGPETWDLIKPCDETLGAGILFNVGPDSATEPCVLAGARRFMVLPGEPEPVAAFDCIARVGNGGPAPLMGERLVDPATYRPLCPVCGRPMQGHGLRERRPVHEMRLDIRRYRCRPCKAWCRCSRPSWRATCGGHRNHRHRAW